MKNGIIFTLIAIFLTGLIFIIYSPQIGGNEWLNESGMTAQDLGPIQVVPFIVLFFTWVSYLVLFQWIYSGMKMSSLIQAVRLGAGLWIFLAFPVIAVHYLFLQFSWKIILLDSASQLTAMLSGAVLLWGWILKPALPLRQD